MARAGIDAGMVAWLEENEPSMHLSAMTIMEIESGVQQLARQGSTRKGPDLSAWLSGLVQQFGDRVLPFDKDVAMAAGRMEAMAIAKGRHPGLADIIIAATGEVHRLTILTQNVRHFAPLNVPTLNPFKSVP
jgi:predicted nucleic acid-binding protein